MGKFSRYAIDTASFVFMCLGIDSVVDIVTKPYALGSAWMVVLYTVTNLPAYLYVYLCAKK